MLIIVDYGLGNIKNIKNAMERLGYPCELSSDKTAIENADKVLLPGVGSFKEAMANLVEKDLISCLRKRCLDNKPTLGICLGMQLLFEESEEFGTAEGLGILEGRLVKFDNRLKVPHMGWNDIKIKQNPITKDVPEDAFCYFVHSYYLTDYNEEDLIAYCEYGIKVPAIVGKGNVYGMQFHPEKSGTVGELLLKNFMGL